MKPDRETWAEALQLLDAAIDLAPDQQADWLAGVSVRSPHARTLLAQLLADRRAVETAQFLQAHAPLPELPPSDFEAGQLIGPYRLLRLLGRGGMAVVWLAERADAAHRRPVALKLPQLGGVRARVISERFLRERSILSDLAHPHITAVLDAGSDGVQPWLALEFVDGLPLTQFCDQQRLDVADRLRLFVQVLRAVQHAHAQGVIHRDLKPGNVLVDTQHQVKLLDFGVAKLLESTEPPGESTLTQWAGPAMTPDYASPEQLSRQPVGTASDIYTLGVMLYELLLGERPYRLDADALVTPGQAMQSVQPRRPSRVARSGRCAGLPGIAAERLARQLAGDLDTIVMKALQKEPAQRYATVDAFAGDIERHLAQRPILARPDSTWYRATKFAARHRAGVAVSAVIGATLIGAMAATLWQARIARLEGERAQATRRFLVGLFDNSARQGGAGTPAHEVTGKQLLEVGAQRLLSEYREPTELRLELLRLLADLSEQLDLLVQSRQLIDEAVQLTRQLHGEDDVRYAEALMLAAEVKARASDYEASLAQGEQALQGYARVRTAPAEQVAQTHILLGNVLDQMQRHAASRAHLETALQLLQAAGSTTEQRSRANFYLARAFEAERDLPKAEAQYLDGIAQAEKNFGPRSYIAAFGYENYGDLLRQMARFDDAQRYLRQALEVYAVVLGPKHLSVGGARFELGQVLAASGQRLEADRTYRDAIALLDEVAGPTQPDLVSYQIHVRARLLVDMGQMAEARALYEYFLKRWPAGSPARQRRIIAVGLGYSRVLIEAGELATAGSLLDEVEVQLRGKPLDDLYAAPERIKLAARRAEVAQAGGDRDGARRLVNAALDRPVPAVRGDLSAGLDLLEALAQTAPPPQTARAALALFAKLGDEAAFARRDVEHQARLDQVLGRLMLRAGDAAGAQGRLQRAVDLRGRIDVPASPWLAAAQRSLVEARTASK